MRLGLNGLILSLLALPAFADGSQLKPAGWSAKESSYTGAWTFTSPDEMSEAHVHFNDVAAQPVLAETARKHMQPYNTDVLKMNGPMTSDGVMMSVGGYVDEDSGQKYIATSAVIPHKLGGHLICYVYAPMNGTTPPPILTSFVSACQSFAANGTAYDEEQARTAKNRAAIASTPIASGKGRAVEAFLFEVYYISGYGGAVYPDYRPVVLFKDGTMCRCLDLPVSDIDPSVLIKTRPDDVARWKKSAKGYEFQWPDSSEPETLETGGERPVAYPKGQVLDGYWSRIGGGGNTALGGDVSVMTSNGYRFYKDGTFGTQNVAGGSAPGVATSSKSADGGKYSIGADGLLTLTYKNGKTERTTLFRGNGAKPVLWIGGESFVP
jgi:hypothetical protein